MSTPLERRRRPRIVLDDNQYRRVAQQARLTGRTVNDIVREAVARWLEAREPRPIEETEFWKLVGSFPSGQDGTKPISENVDYYLYEDYLAKKKTGLKPQPDEPER